jgi:hypothetical protein
MKKQVVRLIEWDCCVGQRELDVVRFSCCNLQLAFMESPVRDIS